MQARLPNFRSTAWRCRHKTNTHTHTTPSKPAAQALRDVKARGCLAGDWNSPLPSRTSGQVVKRQQLLSSLVADRFALSTTACIQRLPRCYLQPVQPRLTQTRRPMTQLFRAAAKGPITNLAQLRACKPFFVGTDLRSNRALPCCPAAVTRLPTPCAKQTTITFPSAGNKMRRPRHWAMLARCL